MTFIIEMMLVVLAGYQITSLLTHERGPFDILLRLRIKLGVYDLDDTGVPLTQLGRLFECAYCLGPWVALVGVLVWYAMPFTLPSLAWLFILWCAVSGALRLLRHVSYFLNRA